MNCKWESLSGEEVEKEVINYKTSFNKCKKVFRNDEEFGKLVVAIDQFLKDIKEFEQFVPLAVSLRVDGMMERHWEELSKKVGFRLTPRERNFTLKRIIKLKLVD